MYNAGRHHHVESDYTLTFHVKEILLYYVLPQLQSSDPTIFPPHNINKIIDKAINEYIKKFEK